MIYMDRVLSALMSSKHDISHARDAPLMGTNSVPPSVHPHFLLLFITPPLPPSAASALCFLHSSHQHRVLSIIVSSPSSRFSIRCRVSMPRMPPFFITSRLSSVWSSSRLQLRRRQLFSRGTTEHHSAQGLRSSLASFVLSSFSLLAMYFSY